MFEHGLMESGGLVRTRQKWTATFSLVIQAALVALVALLPLMNPQGLSIAPLKILLLAPPPSPPPAPALSARSIRIASAPVYNDWRTTSKITLNHPTAVEDAAAPPDVLLKDSTGGKKDGVLGSFVGTISPPPLVEPTPARKEKPASIVRVSAGVAEGNLLRRVEPRYPQMAKIARIQGDVILQATINKSGLIENLRAISGHPMLLQSAIEAVKQWQYRPTRLNGEPVEVETSITVRFRM